MLQKIEANQLALLSAGVWIFSTLLGYFLKDGAYDFFGAFWAFFTAFYWWKSREKILSLILVIAGLGSVILLILKIIFWLNPQVPQLGLTA